MWAAVGMVAAGAALLAIAGDKLVDFASALAARLRVSTAVIGLTVVAAGTSAPELFVSVIAALRGAPTISLGNVVGSNIANIGLILGVTAVVSAVPFTERAFAFEYPFLVLASWITLLLCRDGWIDRLESAFFAVSMVAFLAYSVWVARREVSRAEAEELVRTDAASLGSRPAALLIAGLLAAMAGLGGGAQLLVTGAVDIAHRTGLGDRVIGLTIVAIGTSLPELVASLAAALKRQHEMAVANVVGSNIFNLLLILGVTGLLSPIPADPTIVSSDMWVMMGFTVLLFPLVAKGRVLSRVDGAVLVVLYLGYLSWLALSR